MSDDPREKNDGPGDTEYGEFYPFQEIMEIERGALFARAGAVGCERK